MTRRLATFALVVAFALTAGAEDPPQTPPPSEHEQLLRAAEEAKKKRQESTRRVLTNADVKKAKGTVVVAGPSESAQKNETAPTRKTMKELELERTAARAHEAAVRNAESAVASAEKEVAELARSYYDEDSLDHRDRVIAVQFEAARLKLEKAKSDLESLKRAAETTTPDE